MKARLINCFVDLNLRSWVTRLLTWLLRLGFYYPGVEPWGWNANPVETVGHYNADRDEVTFGAKLERSPCWLFLSKTPKYNQISISNLTTGISSFIHSWMLFFSDWQVQQSGSTGSQRPRCGWDHPTEYGQWLESSQQPDPRGIQVLDKVLRYASDGSFTAGGPARVGFSAPDVLSLIRAVYEVSP